MILFCGHLSHYGETLLLSCIVRPSSDTVPGLSWPYQVCITSKEGQNKCEIYDPKQPLPRGNDFWGKDWKY